jgi:hypothetical protein
MPGGNRKHKTAASSHANTQARTKLTWRWCQEATESTSILVMLYQITARCQLCQVTKTKCRLDSIFYDKTLSLFEGNTKLAPDYLWFVSDIPVTLVTSERYYRHSTSVADPGCLSRIRIRPFFDIPDPGSDCLLSRIPILQIRKWKNKLTGPFFMQE